MIGVQEVERRLRDRLEKVLERAIVGELSRQLEEDVERGALGARAGEHEAVAAIELAGPLYVRKLRKPIA